jgi:hypothetical protein
LGEFKNIFKVWGFFGLISKFGDFKAIFKVWKSLEIFLGFGDFWAIFRVWKVWGCFRSMASYDSDVLVDIGDYDSSSFTSDEKLFQRMRRVHQMVLIVSIAITNTLDFV